jgi:hypothetical protein
MQFAEKLLVSIYELVSLYGIWEQPDYSLADACVSKFYELCRGSVLSKDFVFHILSDAITLTKLILYLFYFIATNF